MIEPTSDSHYQKNDNYDHHDGVAKRGTTTKTTTTTGLMDWTKFLTPTQHGHYDAQAELLYRNNNNNNNATPFGILVIDSHVVELLEFNAKRWWTLASLPSTTATTFAGQEEKQQQQQQPMDNEKREGFACTRLGSTIFVIGGMIDDDCSQSLDIVHYFSSFGGRKGSGVGGLSSSSSSSSSGWNILKTPMLTPRCYPAAIGLTIESTAEAHQTSASIILVFGGRSRQWEELNTVECYQFIEETDAHSKKGQAGEEKEEEQEEQDEMEGWITLEPFEIPRMAPSVIAVDPSNIFLIGGYDGVEWTKSIECYNFYQNEWTNYHDYYDTDHTNEGEGGGGGSSQIHTPPPDMPIRVSFPKAHLIKKQEKKTSIGTNDNGNNKAATKWLIVVIGIEVMDSHDDDDDDDDDDDCNNNNNSVKNTSNNAAKFISQSYDLQTKEWSVFTLANRPSPGTTTTTMTTPASQLKPTRTTTLSTRHGSSSSLHHLGTSGAAAAAAAAATTTTTSCITPKDGCCFVSLGSTIYSIGGRDPHPNRAHAASKQVVRWTVGGKPDSKKPTMSSSTATTTIAGAAAKERRQLYWSAHQSSRHNDEDDDDYFHPQDDDEEEKVAGEMGVFSGSGPASVPPTVNVRGDVSVVGAESLVSANTGWYSQRSVNSNDDSKKPSAFLSASQRSTSSAVSQLPSRIGVGTTGNTRKSRSARRRSSNGGSGGQHVAFSDEQHQVKTKMLKESISYCDFQGRSGQYFGQVEASTKIPHGKGQMKWASVSTTTTPSTMKRSKSSKTKRQSHSDGKSFSGSTITSLSLGDLEDGKTGPAAGGGDDGAAFSDVYDGDWQFGYRHGYGRMTYATGDVFEGWFQRDRKHGHGTYQWRDGRQYDGNYHQDRADDMKGTLTWKNGTVFVGQFQRGKRTGRGVIQFPSNLDDDNDVDGNNHGSQRHRQQQERQQLNVCYQGDFVNGKYDGFGTCTFPDGRVYIGHWRRGKAHGQGKLIDADGSTILHEGEWSHDVPIPAGEKAPDNNHTAEEE